MKICLKRKDPYVVAIAIMLISSLSNVFFTSPASAQRLHQAQTVHVDPPENIFYTNITPVNSTFTISVAIRDAANVAGTQFRLSWNSSVLSCNSIVLPSGHFMDPMGVEEAAGNLWVLQLIKGTGFANYAVTYYNMTAAKTRGTVPRSGNGTLATLTMKIIKEAPTSSALSLTNVVLGDEFGTPLSTDTEDGSFSYLTPTPVIKVDPPEYSPTRRNQTFAINVNVENLTEGLQTAGIQFGLRYDPELLEFVDVTNGTFMETFGVPPNGGVLYYKAIAKDNVVVGVLLLPDENGTWHAPFPNGNGIIATVSFKVIHGPPISSVLELFDTVIGNVDANPITHTTEDGLYNFEVETLIHPIPVDTLMFYVVTVSNTTVSYPATFDSEYGRLAFTMTSLDGVVGFVNVTIPNAMMWLENPAAEDWLVMVNGVNVTPTVSENGTHSFLYFTGTFSSTLYVSIFSTGWIPEYSAALIALFLILSLTTILISKRWRRKQSEQPIVKLNSPL